MNENNVARKAFYELDLWKNARLLRNEALKIIRSFPADEKYGLSDQIKRASISIAACIAEGHGRFTFKRPGSFLHNGTRLSYRTVKSFYRCLRSTLYYKRDAGTISGKNRRDFKDVKRLYFIPQEAVDYLPETVSAD